MDYSDEGTAQAALCLFLMGVCPLEGGGIAIPLVSDEHVSHASLNFRHFEFDYDARRIKLPVWGGTTLEFSYGTSPVAVRFERDGIYEVRFDSDWNSVSQLGLLCGLYASELYSALTSADTFGGRIS